MRARGITAASLGLLATSWGLSACWGVDYQKVAAGAGGTGGSAMSCPPFTGLAPDDCDPALLSSAESCCVEGRSCQGGSCVEGRCAPVTLSQAQGEAIDVIYLNGQVLWSTGSAGDLLAIPAEGNALPVIVAHDEAFVTDLGSDGERVFWVEYDGTQVRSVDPAQPGSERLVADTGTYFGRWGRLTVDAEDVWWATEEPGAIWRARKDGSESTAPQLVHLGGAPHAVAVDETHVYWTDASATAGAVRRLLRSEVGTGATPEEVAVQQSWVTDIAVAAGRVYWLDAGVHSITTALSSRVQIASASGPWALALDDHFVYWSDEELDTVSRARRDGGGVIELAAGDNPKGLAGSCDTLFFANWSESAAHYVGKVAK